MPAKLRRYSSLMRNLSDMRDAVFSACTSINQLDAKHTTSEDIITAALNYDSRMKVALGNAMVALRNTAPYTEKELAQLKQELADLQAEEERLVAQLDALNKAGSQQTETFYERHQRSKREKNLERVRTVYASARNELIWALRCTEGVQEEVAVPKPKVVYKALPPFANMQQSKAFIHQFHPEAKLVKMKDKDLLGRLCFGVSLDGMTAPLFGVASTQSETWKTFAWTFNRQRETKGATVSTETKLVRLKRTIDEEVVVRVPKYFDVEAADEDDLFQMADSLDIKKHGERPASPAWHYECSSREVEELDDDDLIFQDEDDILDAVSYVKEKSL